MWNSFFYWLDQKQLTESIVIAVSTTSLVVTVAVLGAGLVAKPNEVKPIATFSVPLTPQISPTSSLLNEGQTPSPLPSTTQVPPGDTTSPTIPPPSPSGCYVTVSGALYNMEPIIKTQVTLTDPSGKTRKKVHNKDKNNNILCGTLNAPIDNTSTFLEKHFGKYGCYPRLSPFYAGSGSPPADPQPICSGT